MMMKKQAKQMKTPKGKMQMKSTSVGAKAGYGKKMAKGRK
jgi:hypothetical protein